MQTLGFVNFGRENMTSDKKLIRSRWLRTEDHKWIPRLADNVLVPKALEGAVTSMWLHRQHMS